MARQESIALGGYYKTPTHLIPLIADLFDTEDCSEVKLCDPCAGEGEAINDLGTLLGVKHPILACELETKRFETLKETIGGWQQPLCGDAFLVEFGTPSVGLLYLNPPYDLDPVHGRLEEKFLERFTQALIEGGLLVFVVPHYALKASAKTLAQEYQDLACYRFPDEDFAVYKQVVLIARKTVRRFRADSQIVAQVEAWSASVEGMPVLGTPTEKYKVSDSYYVSSATWILREIDIQGLMSKSRPWRQTLRGGLITTPHILPDVPVTDLLFRTFPVVTTPRPAHIAAGIASGMFNGKRVSSETPGMPDLLVKGVFRREYETIEEKVNKDGDVIAVEQVQKPSLVTTIFDLQSRVYRTLLTEGRTAGLETIEDLLHHYGPSLMKVMGEQCPVMYAPARDSASVQLVEHARSLFQAQNDATKALVTLLGGHKATRQERKYKAAILLGEIGCGKTTCALTVGGTVGQRMLVMCPPHLLDSWTDETQALYPHAEIRVLQNISDVDDLANVPKDKVLVAIVSRETAKLGHGWTSVSGACPKCGAELPEGDLAKKRVRCSHQQLIPNNTWAKRAVAFAYKLMSFTQTHHMIEQLLDGRAVRKHLKTATVKDWPGFDKSWVAGLIPKVLAKCGESDTAKVLLGQLLLADYSEERIEALIRKLATDDDWRMGDVARALTLLLKPHSELQKSLRSYDVFTYRGYGTFSDDPIDATETRGYKSCLGEIHWIDGKLKLDGARPGSLDTASRILGCLAKMGSFVEGPECGEPLFQAVPSPRRYPLAKYIAKSLPDFFDLFIADECHEYASDGSAQERAAHRLTALGIPTLLLTGSLMNGYAESLFTNLWSTAAEFREEFGRHEISRFIERYGYRKRIVSERDAKTKAVVSYGSHTDRVERSERITGDAPGILPLFLFRHLLKISVTLHKADLVELPKCHQIRHLIEPSAELKKGYEGLLNSLRQQIRKDRFRGGYAGKLFGALAELPSYLDRATLDTGNQDDGSFEIRYPESLDSELVATGMSFNSDVLSSKEQWLIETVKAEHAEGRNVMVLGWHVNLLPRLSRILKEALGEEAPILYADKVATGKRQDWINKQIVAKKRRILIANPVCIQTGLNNLVHFSTQIWMENPGANPTIVRQTIGRIDRIGQDEETRVYFPVYKGTLQEAMYDLLMRKIAVATSTDGLDPESVLLAAGGGSSSYLTGLSIGKQLWAMMKEVA